MRTIEVTVKFLHPRHSLTAKECKEFVAGNCGACGEEGTVALITSDEFTDFYACHNCELHIHRDVLQLYVNEEVPCTGDAIADMIGALAEKPQ